MPALAPVSHMDTDSNRLESRKGRGDFLVWVVIATIFAFGIFFRLYNLEELPQHIHNDEAATAIYITPPFFNSPPDPIMWGQNNYGGHANFGAWLASLSLRAFDGKSLWSIRMGSMVCGVLSILFGALFVRSWLGLRAAMFFLVGVIPFHLHIHFSRTGFIYIQAALFIAVVASLFSRFVRAPSMVNGALLGVGTGFALMVYSATHVLVGAIPLGVLAVLCSRTTKESVRRHPVIKRCGVVVAVCVGLCVSFGQFGYHAYHDGFSSRLEQQSIFKEEGRQDLNRHLGRELSVPELALENLKATVAFFWMGDRSVQYGLTQEPLETTSAWVVLLGFSLLLFRSLKLDPCAIFVSALAAGSLVGAGLMVERNFAPHLIAFGLILPWVAALALENICRVLRITSPLVGAGIAIALFVPWANWNYELYTQFDRTKRNVDTYVLHLPIQRDSVKRIANYTPFHMDLAESFYMLRYPNAKVSDVGERTDIDVPAEVSKLVESGECPCIIVLTVDRFTGVPQVIEATRKTSQEFPSGANDVKVLYIR